MNRSGKGLQNLSKLRRKLRRFGEVVESEIGEEMEGLAEDIALDMRGLTPIDTGLAVRQIDYKMGRDGLSAKVGIRTPTRAKKAFYFAFLDAGTRGDPSKNIPPMQPLNIRDRAFDMNKETGMQRIKDAVQETIRKAGKV